MTTCTEEDKAQLARARKTVKWNLIYFGVVAALMVGIGEVDVFVGQTWSVYAQPVEVLCRVLLVLFGLEALSLLYGVWEALGARDNHALDRCHNPQQGGKAGEEV